MKVHEDGDANCYTILDKPDHWLAAIRINGEKPLAEQRSILNLFASAPAMYNAVEAADTLCAVLNISDLTPQAQGCVREAWPLIQIARAAARPDSNYAKAVQEGLEHEIKRLDKIIWTLIEAIRITRVQSIGPDWTKGQAFDFIRDHAKAALSMAAQAGFDYRTKEATKADAADTCHSACGQLEQFSTIEECSTRKMTPKEIQDAKTIVHVPGAKVPIPAVIPQEGQGMSKPTLDTALGIVDRLLRGAEGFAGTTIKVKELEKIREVIVREIIKIKPTDTGGMDPDCYYAKSCGFELGTCSVCKDRRQVPADGIYYRDEME